MNFEPVINPQFSVQCFVYDCLPFCPYILQSLHCLSFCHLRLLITSYVSSNLSYVHITDHLQSDREYMPIISTQTVIIIVDLTVTQKHRTKYYSPSISFVSTELFILSIISFVHYMYTLYKENENNITRSFNLRFRYIDNSINMLYDVSMVSNSN